MTLSMMLVSCASDAMRGDGDYMVETQNETMTNANPVGDLRNEDQFDYSEIKSELDESNIYFAFDSNKIKSTEKDKLKVISKTIKAAPAGSTVIIKGYTDATGPANYNKDLARRRANAARAALIDYGVSPIMLDTKSMGEAKANANLDNQTTSGWGFKNEDRKVSFDIIKKEKEGKSQNSTTSSEMY